MKNIRLISRLDVKGSNLIKGVHLEGLRVIGDPQKHAIKYYSQGVDEIIYMDVVASLYGRNNLTNIVEYTANNVFVPITVGGGIRSVEDARKLLRSGADKIAINTAAIQRPELLSEIADVFGSQCVVLSIEAKSQEDGSWEALTDNGRERSGLDVLEWSKRAVELGVGEILLTSIDREGTGSGFDYGLVKSVSNLVTVPVIASGGMGSSDDVVQVVNESNADAVAMADVLHYEKMTINEIRASIISAGIPVRKI